MRVARHLVNAAMQKGGLPIVAMNGSVVWNGRLPAKNRLELASLHTAEHREAVREALARVTGE